MANVRFCLRSSDERMQSVYLSFRFGRNDKLFYALPTKASPTFWDSEKERVRVSRYCPYADGVNNFLSGVEKYVEDFISDSVERGELVTKESLRHHLDVRFGKATDTSSFHEFFKSYIKECDVRLNGRRGGQKVTYKTKREYARTYEYICMYEKKRKVHLEFADIDQSMLTDFVGFLQGLNLSTNTIAHKVISLKAAMRAAVERDFTDNRKWMYYKIATEETEAVALNEDELERLREFPFKDGRLERIRDLFLLMCWTGLRFSDVMRLRQENIQDDLISIQQQKTNNYVTIPVHPVFREIWERYQGLPIKISNQRFNENIKEICKAVGINDKVIKSITRGGVKQTRVYEKWELVSAHTGRRSFATNVYKSGFPHISIMKITGHRTEAAFLKYIKVTQEEHAKLLLEHWKKSFEH